MSFAYRVTQTDAKPRPGENEKVYIPREKKRRGRRGKDDTHIHFRKHISIQSE